jgi:hypothetical protein
MTETKTGVTEFKTLDPSVRSFEANGKKYIVHENLTESGYEMMEALRLEMETGSSAGDLVKTLGKAVNMLKTNNVYEASLHLYNATNAAERISNKVPHPLLLTLTLFVRPQGADLSQWNESEAIEWLSDFNKEGYKITDLFKLADACKIAFASGFLQVFQTTFDNEAEKS